MADYGISERYKEWLVSREAMFERDHQRGPNDLDKMAFLSEYQNGLLEKPIERLDR